MTRYNPASEPYVDLIKHGVPIWNAWRQDHNHIRPSLAFVDLSDMDLSGIWLNNVDLHTANFSGANLSHASFASSELWGCDFRQANLHQAYLGGTTLQWVMFDDANLSHADLYQADLRGARLRNTNLSYAKLHCANLCKTQLEEVDVRHTIFSSTMLADVDLRSLRNIEHIEHQSSSHVSLDTILRSQGTLPLSFLRGVGTPEAWIDLLAALPKNPSHKRCFILHSPPDRAIAYRLAQDLQDVYIRCWLSTNDPFDEAHDRYREGFFLLLISHHALKELLPFESKASGILFREREEKQQLLTPLALDNAITTVEDLGPKETLLARCIYLLDEDQQNYQHAFKHLLARIEQF